MNSALTYPPQVYLIGGLVFAFIAYLLSERFRRRCGVTPWRWPSPVWGVIGLLFGLFGLLVMLIANRQTLKKLANGAYGPGSAGAGPPGYSVPAAYGPASLGVPSSPPGTQHDRGPSSPSGQEHGAGANPPPAWHPDPGGRHHYRYWDGNRWTEFVSDNGETSVDPPPY